MEYHIGCSGFYYKHWKNVFYPEGLAQRKWFEYYTQQFLTLELNVTFYRFPRVAMLKKWYNDSPAEFRFSVKAPKAITHFKQFHQTVDMITDFYTTIHDGLGEKLGPVLFQFPPRFHYSSERLDRVLQQLDPGFNNVLEFRHASWWRPDVFEMLEQRGITFCGMSYPQLPDDLIDNSPVLYYRFHGVPQLYTSSYSNEFLANIAGKIKSNDKIKEAWLYFNNDASVAAIPNAQALDDLLSR